MIEPTDTTADYTEEQFYELKAMTDNFVSILTSLRELIEDELTNKKEVLPEKKSNLYIIDRKIIVDYEKHKNDKLTIAEIFELYDKWISHYYSLVYANIGNLKNKGLLKHIADISNICSTISFINID